MYLDTISCSTHNDLAIATANVVPHLVINALSCTFWNDLYGRSSYLLLHKLPI